MRVLYVNPLQQGLKQKHGCHIPGSISRSLCESITTRIETR